MRLTKEKLNWNISEIDDIRTKHLAKCFNKLSQLEDIEHDLGIDLITLFKSNLEGVYLKGFDNKFPVMIRMGEISHTITLHTCNDKENIMLKVKDYGKTWSLVKEELE